MLDLGVRRAFEVDGPVEAYAAPDGSWWGRWGVWPAMSAPFFAVAGAEEVGEAFLYLGLLLTWTATALYMLDARRQLRGQPSINV